MTSADQINEPVVIRLPSGARVYVICFGLLWVALLTAALIRSPMPQALILVPMATFGIILTFRLQSQRLVAGTEGLLVRNFFRTFRYRWQEVEDFRLGTATGLPFGRLLLVLLRSGEVITADVTARPWVFLLRGGKLEPTLARLRLWLPPEV